MLPGVMIWFAGATSPLNTTSAISTLLIERITAFTDHRILHRGVFRGRVHDVHRQSQRLRYRNALEVEPFALEGLALADVEPVGQVDLAVAQRRHAGGGFGDRSVLNLGDLCRIVVRHRIEDRLQHDLAAGNVLFELERARTRRLIVPAVAVSVFIELRRGERETLNPEVDDRVGRLGHDLQRRFVLGDDFVEASGACDERR